MTDSDTQPTAPSRPGRSYIIGTGVLCFFFSVLSLLTIERGAGSSAYDIGYLIGQFTGALVFPAAIAAAIYWIARKATRGNGSKSIKIVFGILVVWLVLDMAHIVGTVTSPQYQARFTVTAAERQGLHVSPDSIRHETLGFALPNPGVAFARAEAAESTLTKEFKPGMVAWIFRDTAHQRALSIQVTKFVRLDEGGFRSFARGMSHAVPASAIIGDTVEWTGRQGDYRLMLHHPNGMFSLSRCVPRLKSAGALVVCAQMIGLDSANLAAVPNGLTVND